MGRECRLQLLGIKQLSLQRVKALLKLGCLETVETIQCPYCCERYHLIVDAGEQDPTTISIINLADPIKSLCAQVSSEHASGHCSELLVVGFDGVERSAHRAQYGNVFLCLRRDEQITACWASGVLRDYRFCSHCQQRGFRVVQVTSSNATHRYVSLCEEHFLDACLLSPELVGLELDVA